MRQAVSSAVETDSDGRYRVVYPRFSAAFLGEGGDGGGSVAYGFWAADSTFATGESPAKNSVNFPCSHEVSLKCYQNL